LLHNAEEQTCGLILSSPIVSKEDRIHFTRETLILNDDNNEVQRLSSLGIGKKVSRTRYFGGRITPVYKKGAHSDPTIYRPIAVLPTLSRVFEQLLMTQLQHQILPYISPKQFGFLKGSSTSNAGDSLASAILAATANNHWAD